MNREIKFRAWNTIVQRMQYFTLSDLESQKDKIQWHILEIMQYTGLKDKLCKEIYDGDILKGDNDVIYKVFFYEGSFMASVEHYYKEKCPMPYHLMQFQMSSISVIGNIYQNPYLLNWNINE